MLFLSHINFTDRHLTPSFNFPEEGVVNDPTHTFAENSPDQFSGTRRSTLSADSKTFIPNSCVTQSNPRVLSALSTNFQTRVTQSAQQAFAQNSTDNFSNSNTSMYNPSMIQAPVLIAVPRVLSELSANWQQGVPARISNFATQAYAQNSSENFIDDYTTNKRSTPSINSNSQPSTLRVGPPESQSNPRLIRFNKAINEAAKNGNLNEAQRQFNLITLNSLVPNVSSFTALINAYVKVGLITEAITVFQNMQLAGVEPDAHAFNSMINAFIQSNRINDVFRIYQDMLRARVTPDIVTFNSVIKAYIKANQLRDAFKVYQDMLLSGIIPNVFTYNSLIYCCIKANRALDAFVFYQAMQIADIKPNVLTLNLLISACLQTNREIDAFRFYLEMQNANVKPNVVTLHSLIDAAVTIKDLRLAEAIYRDLSPDMVVKVQNDKPALDCHGLSHGTACIQLLVYLKEKNPDRLPFTVITGWGKHGKNEELTMQTKVLQFVQEYLSDWTATQDPNNKGCLLLNPIKIEKT